MNPSTRIAPCVKCKSLTEHAVISMIQTNDFSQSNIQTYWQIKCPRCGNLSLDLTLTKSISDHSDFGYISSITTREKPEWAEGPSSIPSRICFMIDDIYRAISAGCISVAFLAIKAALDSATKDKANVSDDFNTRISMIFESGIISEEERINIENFLLIGSERDSSINLTSSMMFDNSTRSEHILRSRCELLNSTLDVCEKIIYKLYTNESISDDFKTTKVTWRKA